MRRKVSSWQAAVMPDQQKRGDAQGALTAAHARTAADARIVRMAEAAEFALPIRRL